MARRHNKRRRQSIEQRVLQQQSSKRPYLRWLVPFAAGSAIASILAISVTHYIMSAPAPSPLNIDSERSASSEFPSLGALASMSDGELAVQDLAMINLRCAEGLPRQKPINFNRSLQTLDKWAAHIKLETDRHLYRVRDPKYAKIYRGSESFFRATMMLQVLQEDFGVHYKKARIREIDFKKPEDIFIHGMIENKNGGTCVSMPVLYTIMGRRLGYPIKLVLAKAHVFCRWDGPDEQFNIEGSGEGFSSHENDYYMKWPKEISESEIKSGQYLRSLSPREELAVFLAARGHCFEDHRKSRGACLAYAQASLLAPKTQEYAYFLRGVTNKAFGIGLPPRNPYRPTVVPTSASAWPNPMPVQQPAPVIGFPTQTGFPAGYSDPANPGIPNHNGIPGPAYSGGFP